MAYVSDQSTDTPIDDPGRLATIEEYITTVLRATAERSPSETHINPLEVKANGFPCGDCIKTNVERRLHQLMLSVRDFDGQCGPNMSRSTPSSAVGFGDEEGMRRTAVYIESCEEKGYSIVSVDCKDRPRLMFDTVCTLTDMQYVVFHASIGCHGDYAFQVRITSINNQPIYIHIIFFFGVNN